MILVQARSELRLRVPGSQGVWCNCLSAVVCLLLLTPASAATIVVQPTTAGTTPNVLGYNLGHFMPGSNTADWFRYSGVKAARVFIGASDIEPHPGNGDGVTDGTSFFARRSRLRANAADPSQPVNPKPSCEAHL